jgi:hypothetical protein
VTQIHHIPEQRVEGKPLGRHIQHDPKSRKFAANRATKLYTVSHTSVGLPLNQGKIGSCTGNALCGALNSEPNHKTGGKIYREKDAVQVYEWETAAEGQPYPPNDPGGTGLMVCKVAKQHFWISGYHHAFGIQHALEALVLRPVITGVSWYDSFDQPDKHGMVSIAEYAQVRGGHEFVVDQLVVPDGATADDLDDIIIWPVNSWGKPFGLNGRFGMTAATWNTLLQDRGDVTVPIA